MPDFDSASAAPLARRWTEEAARDELTALVQFAFLRRPLAELLQACAEASLDLIVLKGAALAETVYPRPGLRSFGDIDVLVRPEDAPRAYAVLSALGYVVAPDSWADLIGGRGCEANFFAETERGPVVVELHTNLLNNALLHSQAYLHLDGLWQRTRPAQLAGRDARVLGPEDQIIHLCLHLAGHYFAASKSVRDLVQVCAVQTVDWPLLLALCRQSGIMTIAYSGLFAATLGGAAVPPDMLEALAPHRRRAALESLVTAQVSQGDTSAADSRRFRLLWLMLDRPAARFRALCRLVFPDRAWLHAHYFHDLFDPPDTTAPRRFLISVLRCLPQGGLLYVLHAGFLLRQGLTISRRTKLQTKQLTAGAAILVGVLLLAAAVIYFITPAGSLAGFLPGHEAGAAAPHVKHGILALALALCAFVAARFFYGSAPDTAA